MRAWDTPIFSSSPDLPQPVTGMDKNELSRERLRFEGFDHDTSPSGRARVRVVLARRSRKNHAIFSLSSRLGSRPVPKAPHRAVDPGVVHVPMRHCAQPTDPEFQQQNSLYLQKHI